MEKTSIDSFSSFFSFSELDGFLFFHRFLNWVTRCHSLYAVFLSFFLSHVEFIFAKSKRGDERKSKSLEGKRVKNLSGQQFCSNKRGGLEMSGEEVEMVMGKLGMLSCSRSENFKELGSDEISDLFEEKEPSLGEIKETFCVFDENGDGFIDAEELQRVLVNLGFMEGSNIGACQKMIEAYDENCDGRIDFIEFVKFMENSFC